MKIKNLKDRKATISGELQALSVKLIKLRAHKDGLKKAEADTKKSMGSLESEVFASFLQKSGLKSLEEVRGKGLIEIESLNEERTQLTNKLNQVRREIDDSNFEKIKAMISTIDNTIKEKTKELNEATKALKAEQKKFEQANKDVINLKNEIEKLVKEIHESDVAISQMQAKLSEMSNLKSRYEMQKKQLVYSINSELQKKQRLVEEMSIKLIEIPYLTDANDQDCSVLDIFDGFKDVIKKHFASASKSFINYTRLFEREQEEEEEAQNKDRMKQIKVTSFGSWFDGLESEDIRERREHYSNVYASITQKMDDLVGASIANEKELNSKVGKFEEKIRDVKAKIQDATSLHDDLQKEFDEVKKQRIEAFNKFFDRFSDAIDTNYKLLTKRKDNFGGKALIYKENQNEPYNGGIYYSATPPSKKFVYDVEQLSGGEKTMAGLALLVTANLVNGFPFMILDESDAFLDQTNSLLLLELIKKLTGDKLLQIVTVSHKGALYENAESLVGTTFIPKKLSSQCFSLDLRK